MGKQCWIDKVLHGVHLPMERLQAPLPFCGCRRLPDGPGQQRNPGEIGTITVLVDNFPVDFFFLII